MTRLDSAWLGCPLVLVPRSLRSCLGLLAGWRLLRPWLHELLLLHRWRRLLRCPSEQIRWPRCRARPHWPREEVGRQWDPIGLDDLHPKLLKIAAPFIAQPLASLFNKSLSSGRFPSDFKRAKIIPVPKGNNTNDIGNYRPISLLSGVSKILEKAVHIQLYDYLQEHKLLSFFPL